MRAAAVVGLVLSSTGVAVGAGGGADMPIEIVNGAGEVVLSAVDAEGAVVTTNRLDDATTEIAVSAPAPDQHVSLTFETTEDERFWGLGQRAGAVQHRGSTMLNRVLDGPYTETQAEAVGGVIPPVGFDDRPDATYFPVPWVLSNNGYGLLVDNYEDSEFELAAERPDRWTVSAESSTLALRVFTGATPADTLAAMTSAVGRQPEPAAPFFFGPWWQADADAVGELDALVAAGVPMSLVQTYTHYLPCGDHVGQDEAERVRWAHDAGLAITTYINPMVCVDYRDVYRRGALSGAFNLTPDGLPYIYPYFTSRSFDVAQFDFTSSAGVGLFHDVLDEVTAAGYDGWMEDFGEYTPEDALSADGTPGTMMHNRYPEMYHGAAWEYAQSAPRPLARFNRSGWTGAIASSQVVWGGDPTTVWGFDGLESALYSGLGLGLSGVSIWGSDIGGFFTWPGEESSAELLSRWIEFGAFSGVMRLQGGGISLVETPRPSVLDDGVLDVWRRYAELRTQLYPYLAGSNDAYAADGLPLMRHHVLANPEDDVAVGVDDQYLFGADLLVAPVIEPGATARDVYLPAGMWIDWWTGLRHDGGQTVSVDAPVGQIPLFVRDGAVIPLLPDDVDTLAPYGGDAVVNLDDRQDQRTLLAYAGPDWTGTLGPGETISSTFEGETWTLTFDASIPRTYDLEASLAGLPDDFEACTVTADGVATEFAYDPESRTLTATVNIDPSGSLHVTSCGERPGDGAGRGTTSEHLASGFALPRVARLQPVDWLFGEVRTPSRHHRSKPGERSGRNSLTGRSYTGEHANGDPR